ncbi:winged helix-turn-helix transcriptional regulator [Fodinicola acaciae]|uniref:winged helix-turn-helix transcriptional regulator n=1 Tax=Fodinicola acaciae TaxID=2681555 RepID=UPI0013D8B1DF|nr:helix-turn-helix domain-containing protein [Fodinicola acaciae]
MTRIPLAGVACSIARATDLFGDAWTALIMRDVLAGLTRFDDIAYDLAISRKVLAARLSRLVEEQVLVRERYQEHPPREHYVPTQKGKELYPVLLALMDWGDRWYGKDGPPAILHHIDCDHDTTPVTCCAHCGERLTVDNTFPSPGPGGRVGPGTYMFARLFTVIRDAPQ